jgi:hypothetical protein
MNKDWIKGAVGSHKGALHKALHIPTGETIPSGRLESAEHSKNPKVAKEANLARTLEKLHRRHGGKV